MTWYQRLGSWLAARDIAVRCEEARYEAYSLGCQDTAKREYNRGLCDGYATGWNDAKTDSLWDRAISLHGFDHGHRRKAERVH